MLPYNARSAASSGGGILRKTNSVANLPNTASQQGERQVDLLVFGYACKVFRDDPKAWEIDKGKHLIPWMGDGNLKIDRYDVRGALSELTPYEPPPGGYGNRLDYLSAEEQRAEQLCEEERYFYLYNNEEEHILQQEEDLKRLTQEASGSSYGRVDFQYDAATNGSGEPHGPNLVENQQRNDSPSCDEQPYTMPRSLQVPIPIQLPETMKQHAIIEKTARFIASQGVQMEILLKAKQSNNTQFEFLAQDGYLNPYYKFVLNAIKIGTYPTEESLAKEEEANQNEIKANESATISTKPIITVPTIKYQPSANCAYTQLISKIKGVPLPLPEVLNEVSNLAATTTTSSQPGGTSNAENSIDSPTTPILLQYGENIYVQATEEEEEHNLNSNSNSNSNFNTQTQEPQVEILSNSSALALAQNYSSGTESEDEMEAPEPEPMLRFPIPTENLKNIIDKTATYVIKNGRQFEETLRTKSEERFTFLVPENEYYPYYMYKITGDPNAASKEQKTRKAAAVAAALLSKKGLAGPVSFSIKAKEDTTAANLPAVLPQEPSDDDEDQTKAMDGAGAGAVQQQQQQQRNVPEHVQKAIKLVESQLLARNAQFAAAVGNVANVAATLPTPTQSSTAVRGRFDQLDYNSSTSASKIQMKSTRSEQERNAIYEQQQQNRQKELKKAEEKVKDKLAQIAREKLGGLINKDKQLQLERKRKAMAFINQIKVSGTKTEDDNTTLTNENELANKKDTDGYKSDSSETSVHSIPITSYGPEDDDDDDEQNNMNEPAFSKQFKREAASTRTTKATTNAIRSEKILKAPTTTTKTTTVLLSDDDDIELISESRATSSTALKRLQIYDARERKRRKYSTESDVSQDSTGSSSSSDCSNYIENRRNKSRSHDKRSSSRKSKKSSKKSSKSKKKRKHKSEHKYERRSNTTNTLSKQQEEEEKRRRRHDRHDRRSRTHDSDTYSSSEESQESSVNQRRKLAVYDLFDRDNITPPASPRSSSSSSRRYKDTNERRHRRYER